MTATEIANRPADHPPVNSGRIGVLLVNLGTPDSSDTRSVRRYLAEFLSDRRVIELSPWLWQPILHGVILRTRPPKVAAAYAEIWRGDTDESPLRFYTRRQAELLAERWQGRHPALIVSWAMRYGKPDIDRQLRALQQAGCERILLAPLYPQYSATTTATVNDAAFDSLRRMRWQPALRVLPPYHDHPAYIEAVAGSLSDYLSTCDRQPDALLASFHGLPRENLDKGDPYYCHCAKTTRLLQQRLGLDQEQFRLTFQSRFGPKEWLQPYTDHTIQALAEQGARHIAVVMPGFAADCLETIEEMGIQNRQLFLQHGGSRYDVIPCLNESKPGINMLQTLLEQELSGWLQGD